eukprot:21260-Chlamydomonas_euryale.AAC.3
MPGAGAMTWLPASPEPSLGTTTQRSTLKPLRAGVEPCPGAFAASPASGKLCAAWLRCCGCARLSCAAAEKFRLRPRGSAERSALRSRGSALRSRSSAEALSGRDRGEAAAPPMLEASRLLLLRAPPSLPLPSPSPPGLLLHALPPPSLLQLWPRLPWRRTLEFSFDFSFEFSFEAAHARALTTVTAHARALAAAAAKCQSNCCGACPTATIGSAAPAGRRSVRSSEVPCLVDRPRRTPDHHVAAAGGAVAAVAAAPQLAHRPALMRRPVVAGANDAANAVAAVAFGPPLVRSSGPCVRVPMRMRMHANAAAAVAAVA